MGPMRTPWRGDGEDGPVAVDHVEAEENRDVKAGLLDSDVLKAVDLLDVNEPEDGADFSLGNQLVGLVAAEHGHDDAGGLVHLPDLLIDIHLLEKCNGTAMRLSLCDWG